MSVHAEASHRFLRPENVGRIRRNQRRVQIQRVLVVARNVLLIAGLAMSAMWLYGLTQSGARFSIRRIEIAGAVHTPPAELQAATRRYTGMNLFRIDVARVRRDFSTVSWIRDVEIEKKLPDTLTIRVVERVPAALVRRGSTLRYTDATGHSFADLSPSVGNDDLPLISDATGSELHRTLQFLAALRQSDQQLYARVSEIRPIVPRGFAVFDRDLGTIVYLSDQEVAQKWRTLYSIARAENYGKGAIQYADLRFSGRLVVKPFQKIEAVPSPVSASTPTQITN